MIRFGVLLLLLSSFALAQLNISASSPEGDTLSIEATEIKIDLEELTVLPEQIRYADRNSGLLLRSVASFSTPSFPPQSYPAYYQLGQLSQTIRFGLISNIGSGWRLEVKVGTGDTPNPWLIGSTANTYMLDVSQLEVKVDNNNWSQLDTRSRTLLAGNGSTNGLVQKYQLDFRLQVRGGEIPDCYKTVLVFSLVNNSTNTALLNLPIPIRVCIPKVNAIALSNTFFQFDLNKSIEPYPPLPPKTFKEVSYLPTNLKDPTKPATLWFFSNIPGGWSITVKGDEFKSTNPTNQVSIPLSVFQYCIKAKGDETPCADPPCTESACPPSDWKPFSVSTVLGSSNGLSTDFPFYRIWYRLKLTGNEPTGQYQATLTYTLAPQF